MNIPVKDLQGTQPYIGRPHQLADMVQSILKGQSRQGDKIQLLNTEKGIFVYDGNCWSCATYFAGEKEGRDFLKPEEYDLCELGEAGDVNIWIKGEGLTYQWDGQGHLSKKGKGFNIFTHEKARDENNKRIYRPKTILTLPELAETYREELLRQENAY